jgi:hypothetical protein
MQSLVEPRPIVAEQWPYRDQTAMLTRRLSGTVLSDFPFALRAAKGKMPL